MTLSEGQEIPTVTAETVDFMLAGAGLSITGEESAAMADLVALALKRRNPDVTAEMVAEDMDLDTFLAVLHCIFHLPGNDSLRARF